MKSTNASLRGTAAVIAAVTLAAPVHAAPKKPAPVPPPVAESSPAPAKPGMFGKLKAMVGLGGKPAPAAAPAPAAKVAPAVPKPAARPAKTVKAEVVKESPKSASPKAGAKPKTVETPAAPAPEKPGFMKRLFTREAKPVAAPVAAVKAPPAKSAGAEKTAAAKTAKTKPAEVAAASEPEKKGFIKRLFTREEKPSAVTESQLAKAKTAKPGPVASAKPPAAPDDPAAGELKPKRGFFSFLRRDRPVDDEAGAESPVPDAAKIERPKDWAEHRVTSDDNIALYEFGPSQSSPDARLDRGTVVKVKQVRSGWALVEVPGGRTGYVDAAALRAAAKQDFLDPVVLAPVPAMVALDPGNWAPAPPPPDLPEQPGAMENDPALLLLPPLELEPKQNP